MELAQTRIVTDDVEGMARFYARLLGVEVTPNDFYAEVSAGATTIGFSKCRFTEYWGSRPSGSSASGASQGETILDFAVDDVDGEYERIKRIGVQWVMPPTSQPWGKRSMMFRDPEGHLVNVCSHEHQAQA